LPPGPPVELAGEDDPDSGSERAWLGVELQGFDEALREAFDFKDRGVLVAHVAPGSPADRAGFQRGDIIVSIDGHDVRSPREAIRRVRTHKPGDTIQLGRIRKGREDKVGVKLGAAPERLERRQAMRRAWPGAYLGARVEMLGPELAGYFGVDPKSGALVITVEEDSPAARAGLRPGDVITELAGKRVHSPEELVRVVRAAEPGDATNLTVVRHGKEQKLEVTLAEAPPMDRLRHLARLGEDELDPMRRDLGRRMRDGVDAMGERMGRLEDLIRDLERRVNQLREREDRKSGE
jgi:S1-C subfamily serine protease